MAIPPSAFWRLATCFLWLAMPAQASSLLEAPQRGPLIALSASHPPPQTVPPQASLFRGSSAGLFRTLPRAGSATSPGDPRIGPLLDLIAQAEAGKKGYDAVQYGARIKPERPPTAMTLRQIFDWIARTPGQPHAIGRYQFIPPTLSSLIRQEGVAMDARFSPALQDRLAARLLAQAGLVEFLAGTRSRRDFMHGLARIWAGLPLPSGRSYYQGYAGNKATMSWARFEAGMTTIFPGS